MELPPLSARLACTVRGCGKPLTALARTLTCSNGHSYDRARRGYVNLLQPQDRRAVAAGDATEIVEARSRLFAARVGASIVAAFVERVASLDLPETAQVVDLGCGTGDVLAAVARARPVIGAGIDLSVAAIEHAARSHPALTWIVANADRRLPLPDASTTLVLSMHGRRNPEECARVLRPGGWLLVAVPAPDDLIEARASIHGQATARDRVGALIAEHASFAVVDRGTARERKRLDGDVLRDLLRITYRGTRHRIARQVENIDAMDVTVASDFVLFRPA